MTQHVQTRTLSAPSSEQVIRGAHRFLELLRGSAYSGDADWQSVRSDAARAIWPDPFNYRHEFMDLVDAAAEASGK